MDIDDTADQLLNNIQLQISIEHIPFESIRSNQTVISALQNLVTRAYFDRNYSKQDTRNKIDSLIIAILNALKSPVVDLTADTEDESANPEQQPDRQEAQNAVAPGSLPPARRGPYFQNVYRTTGPNAYRNQQLREYQERRGRGNYNRREANAIERQPNPNGADSDVGF